MKKFTLALIAHDRQKDEMVNLVMAHREELEVIKLVATHGTGQMITNRLHIPVALLKSGPEGGDLQIGAMITNRDVDAVIFLRDPLTAHPREPDVSALLRICDVHNIPLATNVATAEALLHLLFDHPEALSGHHLIAGYLENIASTHN